ncbi:CRISPR/Cas system CSM-associated protein Csm3, group 7 of RAMP superfamily [Clostridium cochlearium]|uniref:CRISPR/Cas system CSM-associated protein Csm3, group 7 of RAMP superfamily n=1 Tax=Clostridium cochlearium TaxID=1494 RepID=A0ABY0QP54_CLOCO|nr:RAMP superfamily CRISPR-associated protein [Clostridium cochlearium]SDL41816.1 CRISPR/Cas system CSM-associated protein Csm3, group 7 of RAMP superfamily [Clostridium cochlearium]
MEKIKYKLNLECLSSFNVSSGEGEDGFIKKHTVKYRNKAYIPGSTLKGLIKDNFSKLVESKHKKGDCNCPICSIFGGLEYRPSKIFVDNLYTEERKNIGVKFGNAIDRYKKVAKDMALFSEEVVFNKNFIGYITLYLDEDTKKYKEYVEMAIKMIDCVGGSKSRGHGFVKIDLEEV